jgi:uncharacterized protein YdeI (YjbR/CyaY-like superfamily)
MTSTRITLSQGTVHKIPDDMRKVILSSSASRDAWQSLTPLARNEWICWTTSVKKQETRDDHLRRLSEDLKKGKRRPCCWAGCPHR